MAVTIFVVRASIAKDKEAAFNKWYNEEHVPQVLQFNGAVGARRYRQILGDDKLEYMAVYEFASEETFPPLHGLGSPQDADQGVRRQLRRGVGARPLRLRTGVAMM